MNTNWMKQFSSIAQRTHPPEISWLMAQALEVPDLISLAVGFVDQISLPHRQVSEQICHILNSIDSGTEALQYGTTRGDFELRTLLVERLRMENAIHPQSEIDASHLVLGSGSQQILYLLSEAMLDEGDIVLLEAPTYFVVLGVLQSRGVRTIGIDTDELGLKPDKVRECLEQLKTQGVLHRVKMLYVMTYSTNPLGVTLSSERRMELMALMREYRESGFHILFVEDAAYRRLSFTESSPAPMKRYDAENDFVFYTESFSKSFSPGLRLGFGIGPKPIIDKIVDIKGNHDFGTSNLCQQIAKQALRMDLFENQVKLLRQVYSRKCNFVMEILRQTMPAEAHWLRPDGGFYTWITLPQDWDTGSQGTLFQSALQEKVLYVPGSLCYSPDRPESKRSSQIRLAFGMIDEDYLKLGCERLGQALHEYSTIFSR